MATLGCPAQEPIPKPESFNSSYSKAELTFHNRLEMPHAMMPRESGWYLECITAQNSDDLSMWHSDGAVLIADQ